MEISKLNKNFKILSSNDLLPYEQLIPFYKSVNIPINENTLLKILKKKKKENFKNFSFSTIVTISREINKKKFNKNEIKSAFKFIKKEKGTIKANDLINLLTTYGNPLTIEEASEFIKLVENDDNGIIDIDNFVDSISNLIE